MTDIGLEVGETAKFSKTVGESDVYQFAGISGDFSPNHVNEEFMKGTPYGHRIAHGVLTLALASTTSTLIADRSLKRQDRLAPVSLGYDRVRFLKGVLIGDTVTVTYTLSEIDAERLRSRAAIEAVNQRGETVMVAEHIMKWVERSA